ncbi:MAG: hypothetical protein QOH67_3005 [Hyphomicrobiales bacterium]|nr:hypothetical protein [Hyphomicrobiales bacterium]
MAMSARPGLQGLARGRPIAAFAYWAATPYIPGVRDFAALASRPLQGSFLDNAESGYAPAQMVCTGNERDCAFQGDDYG